MVDQESRPTFLNMFLKPLCLQSDFIFSLYLLPFLSFLLILRLLKLVSFDTFLLKIDNKATLTLWS